MRAYPTAVPVVLTSAQREAVEHSGGPLLVLGGAGTGKTTALVERFVSLAEAERPEAVLALTVGDAAADALRERLEDRLAPAHEGPAGATFARPCAPPLARRGVEGGPRPPPHPGAGPPPPRHP